MRLINCQTLEIEEFNEESLPAFAILSHTWGNDEVSFEIMKASGGTGGHLRDGNGYKKIKETCRMAKMEGLSHAWVDTCCIDKSSSAELTESINSMFHWYAKSAVCYVFLVDLPTNVEFGVGIGSCKWISRGWTLQETIAPRNLVFYDQQWRCRGNKFELSAHLSAVTGIPVSVLRRDRNIWQYSVAQRMSWAAKRQTTRVEDTAYCLLGIFEVNMPLVYGEGTMAFCRLQEEIIKRNNDLTMFAWNPKPQLQPNNGHHCSVLAASPAAFSDSADVMRWEISQHNPEFAITNKGLRIDDYLHLISMDGDRQKPGRGGYFLAIGAYYDAQGRSRHIGVPLWKAGPDLYLRQLRPLVQIDTSHSLTGISTTATSIFYIMASMRVPGNRTLVGFRKDAVHLVVPGNIWRKTPEIHWDYTDRLFYRLNTTDTVRVVEAEIFLTPGPGPGGGGGAAKKNPTLFVILLDQRDKNRCGGYIFAESRFPSEVADLFQRRNVNRLMRWGDFWTKYPALKPPAITSSVRLTVDGVVYTVTIEANVEQREMFRESVSVEMMHVKVQVGGRENMKVEGERERERGERHLAIRAAD